MTFGESVGESEVEAFMKEMTKDGKLGDQFKVDPPKVSMAAFSGK